MQLYFYFHIKVAQDRLGLLCHNFEKLETEHERGNTIIMVEKCFKDGIALYKASLYLCRCKKYIIIKLKSKK